MSDDKFDVIIIGAGPAGSACAYLLAKAGKQVLVIERGDSAGSKNVTGGRFYTYALDLLDKGLVEEAVLERKVTHEQIMMLGKESGVTVDYHNPSYSGINGNTPVSYSVLRARFDEWLASKAEANGAIIAYSTRVDGLIERDGRIAGVIAGEDEMFADVVIASDGVNSFMAQKAGLISDIESETVGVGVKEIIELPAKIIEERFNLKEDEGAARMILGCTEGTHGGGFLYTNKTSISLGCVFMPSEMGQLKKSVHQIFQDLKMHPSIHPLLEGGKTIEYGAHLVPEAGSSGIPKKLYRDGFLVTGDAAGFVANLGYTIRGIDLAMCSGIAAARAVIAEEDPSKIGKAYMDELKRINIPAAMKGTDGIASIMETPWLYGTLPDIGNDICNSIYSIKGEVPVNIKRSVLAQIKKNNLSIWQLIKFGIKGVWSL